MVPELHDFGPQYSPLVVMGWGMWIQMGMEQAQHTPWEMAWKNNGRKVRCVTERKWQKVTKKLPKSVFGEALTMYL